MVEDVTWKALPLRNTHECFTVATVECEDVGIVDGQISEVEGRRCESLAAHKDGGPNHASLLGLKVCGFEQGKARIVVRCRRRC